MMDELRVVELAEDLAPELKLLAKQIHDDPELGGQEFKARLGIDCLGGDVLRWFRDRFKGLSCLWGNFRLRSFLLLGLLLSRTRRCVRLLHRYGGGRCCLGLLDILLYHVCRWRCDLCRTALRLSAGCEEQQRTGCQRKEAKPIKTDSRHPFGRRDACCTEEFHRRKRGALLIRKRQSCQQR